MAGRNHTQRIEELEEHTGRMATRIEVLDTIRTELKGLLDKGMGTTHDHATRITIIEQTLVIVDIKALQSAIVAVEKEHLGFKRDIDALQRWKEELKKEKDEVTRRWWSFGPNITAAIISGAIALLGVVLTYLLRKT